MSTVTISPKFQVVIPRKVREALGLRPGQKVAVLQLGDCIEIVPLRAMKQLRGSLKGIDTTVDREDDRA
jgi:AbrB family looped-hinge helix DNA binding protein